MVDITKPHVVAVSHLHFQFKVQLRKRATGPYRAAGSKQLAWLYVGVGLQIQRYHTLAVCGIEAGPALRMPERSGIHHGCRKPTIVGDFVVVDRSNVVLHFSTEETNESTDGMADAVRRR